MQQTILIVEDDDNIALYYRMVLEDRYRVLTASTGTHALNLLTRPSSSIDLVILDYRLQDLSGIDVLKTIKMSRPSVPVIFVTAYGDEDVAVKAFRCGALDYLKKPVSYADLLERVEFCLSNPGEICPIRSGDSEMPGKPAITPSKDVFVNHYHSIQRALQFVDDNFTARISLESAAQKACMSRHHFARAFKKATGTTFLEYVTGRRMEKAREMLRDPRRSVTEVAFAVGYLDLTNFVRNFKKNTGYTPTEFKKTCIPS